MVDLIIPQNLHFKMLPLSVQEQEVTYIFQNTYFAKNVQNLHEGLPKGFVNCQSIFTFTFLSTA